MVQTIVKNPATNKIMGVYILNEDLKYEVAGVPLKEYKTQEEAISKIIELNGFDPDLTKVNLIEWEEYGFYLS